MTSAKKTGIARSHNKFLGSLFHAYPAQLSPKTASPHLITVCHGSLLIFQCVTELLHERIKNPTCYLGPDQHFISLHTSRNTPIFFLSSIRMPPIIFFCQYLIILRLSAYITHYRHSRLGVRTLSSLPALVNSQLSEQGGTQS